MKILNLKKFFFIFFLTAYFIIGTVNSTNSGISFDENHEELNWNFHLDLIEQLSNKILSGKEFDRMKFDEEAQLYVGY